MQAAVDRVIRNLTPRQPVPPKAADDAQEDATHFAGQLLENYKSLLAQRSRSGHLAD